MLHIGLTSLHLSSLNRIVKENLLCQCLYKKPILRGCWISKSLWSPTGSGGFILTARYMYFKFNLYPESSPLVSVVSTADARKVTSKVCRGEF